jgi:hypothetical protein
METTHYLTITRPPLVTAHVCDDSTEVVIGIRGGALPRSVCLQFNTPTAGHQLAIAITNAVHDAEKLARSLGEMTEQNYADELLDDLDDRHQADLDEQEAF